MRNQTVSLEESLIGWEVEAAAERLGRLADRLEQLELKQHGRLAQLFARANIYRSAMASVVLVAVIGATAIMPPPSLSSELLAADRQMEANSNQEITSLRLATLMATAPPVSSPVTVKAASADLVPDSSPAENSASTICQDQATRQADLTKEQTRHEQAVQLIEKTLKGISVGPKSEAMSKAEENQHAANLKAIVQRYDC